MIANPQKPTTTPVSQAPNSERGLPAPWPLEVRCLFEALTRPVPIEQERRKRKRIPFRVQAKLWVNNENGSQSSIEVYLRDYDDRGVAYVVSVMLQVGQLVELELPLNGGGSRRVACKVGRCRQFLQGWFEGVLHSSAHPVGRN